MGETYFPPKNRFRLGLRRSQSRTATFFPIMARAAATLPEMVDLPSFSPTPVIMKIFRPLVLASCSMWVQMALICSLKLKLI